MAVWRGEPLHTMTVSKTEAFDMENALRKVGEEKFGEGEFFIDKVQREVPDHLHWHARPNRFDEDHEIWHSDPADITSWRRPYIKLQ